MENTVKNPLDVNTLLKEAKDFAQTESVFKNPALFGVTDGKAVGTYLEHKFQDTLQEKYQFIRGSSAKGIDFPDLSVDIKVTSVKQPQSSCPFRSTRQKIYGLGYSLLVFVYDKIDDSNSKISVLNILHTSFVESSRTADFQTTSGLLKILDNNSNKDDILAFFEERMLPLDSVEAEKLADEILTNPPFVGYLTISNALQWRLQYSRIIEQAGQTSGIIRVT